MAWSTGAEPPSRMKWTNVHGVRLRTDDVTPSAEPEMTMAVRPPSVTRGTLAAGISWYCGSSILCAAGRLIHICRPCASPPPCGISLWRMPFPAVIHCRSPGPIVPALPLLSSCLNEPPSIM